MPSGIAVALVSNSLSAVGPGAKLPSSRPCRASCSASIIDAAVFSIKPCTSPSNTRCLRAALSTGSAQLVYWSVTSRNSSITSSVDLGGGSNVDCGGGKSTLSRLRSRGGRVCSPAGSSVLL